ncbi:MAG TPA: PEP-CTERM sorting domain-containing protein [Tepidisphaeraceae bacterium]|nr:PEP-CTERM sorting domain-containing protein [Tepidisphaeraceae bacterium]
MTEKLLKRAALGFAIGLGVLAAQSSSARAGNLQITITVDNGENVNITDDGVLDMNTTNPGVIDVNTGALNAELGHFMFAGLSLVSNSPGTPSGSYLSLSGVAQLLPGETSGTLEIVASDTGYLSPADLIDTFNASASGTFTNAPAGDTQVFRASQSSANGTKSEQPMTFTSTGLTVNSHSANGLPISFLTAIPYQMTSRMDFSLSNASGGLPNQVQFAGSEQYAPVPEPTSLGLVLGSMAAICLGRRRRTHH